MTVSLGIWSSLVWMLQNDVAPHHHAFAILALQQVVDAANVAHVHTTLTDLIDQRLGRTRSQAKRLVATDIEHGEGEQRTDLGIQVIQQLIARVIRGTQHVLRLAQFGEFRML